jgi:hypothetical protein
MKTISRYHLRHTLRILLLICGVITLTACSLLTGLKQTAGQLLNPATPTPVDPSDAIKALSDEEIQSGIQDVVDNYALAYNTNDLELLQSITDPENLPFKRLVSNRFNDLQESIWASNLNMQYTVQSIKRMPLGFVQAHLISYETSADDWLFRIYKGKWILSEPTEAQFGEPTEKETEHFVYSLYPWSNEINEQIISLMERAAQRVENKLGKLPSEKAKVIILPGYSADPYSDPNSLAYYQTGATGQLDSIVVFCPNSYSFGWYDEQRGWAPDLENTLTHEYTHMTHQRAFGKAGKLLDWFSEGLAEYVSDSPRYYEIQQALEPDRLIPLVDSVSAINQQDLAHIYLLEKDISLAYAEAESLIMFIEQKYGGMDAVWAVARADDEIQNLNEALQSAIGVNLETFNREWRNWLKTELFSN